MNLIRFIVYGGPVSNAVSGIFKKLTDWLKRVFVDMIVGNLTKMFDGINDTLMGIGDNIRRTPVNFNQEVYWFVKRVMTEAIIPIAGILLTYVMVHELVQMIIDRNNLHDVDTSTIVKWILKTFFSITLVNHAWTIVMALFQVGSWAVNKTVGVISNTTATFPKPEALAETLMQLEFAELITLSGLTMIISLIMKGISIYLVVIVYSRMLEMYLLSTGAPLAFSTLGNRELGSTGQNYIKSIFGLALQGFILILCTGIFTVLVKRIGTVSPENFMNVMKDVLIYTILLVISMKNSKSVANSIVGAT